MTDAFAKLPPPPYYAVVFSSQRRDGDNGYGAASDRMVELAQQQPGFLGLESTRGEDGFGITVAYWDSEASIKAWRLHLEHAAKGRPQHAGATDAKNVAPSDAKVAVAKVFAGLTGNANEHGRPRWGCVSLYQGNVHLRTPGIPAAPEN